MARRLNFARSDLVLLDRGYVDFAWLNSLHCRGVGFVNLLPSHVCYQVLEERPGLPDSPVLADQLVRPSATPKERRAALKLANKLGMTFWAGLSHG